MQPAVKKWYQSKTVWIAIAQGVAGVLAAIFASDPGIRTVGFLGMLKSGVDFYIRLSTSSTIV